MAVKDTISKIAKSVGEKATNSNIVRKTKKAGKFINDHLLEDVPDKNKYDSFLYKAFPKRIKQGYAIGAVAGIGAFTAAKGVYNAHNRNDIGTVSHGGLSHMTAVFLYSFHTKLEKNTFVKPVSTYLKYEVLIIISSKYDIFNPVAVISI